MPKYVSFGGDTVPEELCVKVDGKWVRRADVVVDKVEVKKVNKVKPPKVDSPAKPKADPKPELDITGDGKVDEKDASLAGKVLADASKKSTKNSSKKKSTNSKS